MRLALAVLAAVAGVLAAPAAAEHQLGTFEPSALLYRSRAHQIVVVEDRPDELVLHELDRHGRKLKDVDVPPPGPYPYESPGDKIGYDPRDDSYLVTWEPVRASGATEQGIRADGTPLGPPTRLPGLVDTPAPVYAHGRFLVIADVSRRGSCRLYAKQVGARGDVRASAALAPPGACPAVSVAYDQRSGRYLAVWTRLGAVEARPLSASGRPAGPVVTVGSRGRIGTIQMLASDEHGRFVLLTDRADQSTDSLLTWSLDADARLRAARTLTRVSKLDADVSLYGGDIVAAPARNRLIVTWYALTGESSPEGTHFEYVRAQRLSAPTLAPVGPLVRLPRSHASLPPLSVNTGGRYLVVRDGGHGRAVGRFLRP